MIRDGARENYGKHGKQILYDTRKRKQSREKICYESHFYFKRVEPTSTIVLSSAA